MRPSVSAYPDPGRVAQDGQNYVKSVVFQLFVDLHRQYGIEPDISKGYVISKEVAGFDLQLCLTVFESLNLAEHMIAISESSLLAPKGAHRILEESWVREYISRMRELPGESGSHKAEEEPLRRTETEARDS